MVSDVQMHASTLEVMRTPDRRGSATASTVADSASPEIKQQVMRRPSLRSTAMDQVSKEEPAPSVRRGSGSSSSDVLVAEALVDLNKEVLLERDKYERLMIQVQRRLFGFAACLY